MSSTSTVKQEQVLAVSKKQEQVQTTITTVVKPLAQATQPLATATQPLAPAVKAVPNKKVIPPKQVYYDDFSDYDYDYEDDYDEEDLEYQLAHIPADMRAALDPRYTSQLNDFRASCRGYL